MRAHRLRLAPPRRLSNRLALVSALQLSLVTGGFSLLSYNLGRSSGIQLSEIHRQNAAVMELSIHLSKKLSYPIWINALNLQWLRNDPKRARDWDAISERFQTQMQVFPVDYINIGKADGSFIGLERSANGELLLNEDTARSGRGSMAIYALSAAGQRGKQLDRIPGMSATHEEAWYVDTARAGHPTWSGIYAWEDDPEVFSISYNAPIFGPNRDLQGVVGVDLVLSHLSDWLKDLWQRHKGLALIVEPNGALVASSLPDLTLRQEGNVVQRSNLRDLQNPLTQELRRAFARSGPKGELQTLTATAMPRQVRAGGKTYTLQASPWGRQEGLNWIMLTALETDPNSAVAARNSQLALIFAAAALMGALLLISRQIKTLLNPLSEMEVAARKLGANLSQPDGASLGTLSFHSGLTSAAGEELLALDRAISELVQRYNNLTINLQDAQERERFRDAQTMAILKDKLRTSLKASAIAHEINQPLSVLLLNSQLLLERHQRGEGPALPEAWLYQLQSIREEADRVVLIIEKMRALLRNVQSERQRLNLRDVAQSALLYVRSNALMHSVAVDDTELKLLQEPAWIEGDAVQIQIAIVNLLRNAAEALAEPQRDAPWIGIDLRRNGAEWWLSVEDNGPGLPKSVLDDLPLQTSKADGSGLGLFVVRTTMDNHHGAMECGKSARGGALLRLRFPAQACPEIPSRGD